MWQACRIAAQRQQRQQQHLERQQARQAQRGSFRGNHGPRGRGRGGQGTPHFNPPDQILMPFGGQGPARPPRAPRKPWLTALLYDAFRRRNELQRTARSSRNADDFRAFQKQRAVCVRMEVQLRNEYFTKFPDKEQYWLPILASEALNKPRYCDICEEEFENEEALVNHEDDHEECGIQGCTYMASPELVQEHIVNIHATGLYARMRLGYDKEEVKKWRGERKTKWPTHEMTLRHEQRLAEKRERCAQREHRRMEEANDRQKAYREVLALVDEEMRAEQVLTKAEALQSGERAGDARRQRRGEKRREKNKLTREMKRKNLQQRDADQNGLSNDDSDEDGDICSGIPRFRGMAALSQDTTTSTHIQRDEARYTKYEIIQYSDDSDGPPEETSCSSNPVGAPPEASSPQRMIKAASDLDQSDPGQSQSEPKRKAVSYPVRESRSAMRQARARILMQRRALFTVLGSLSKRTPTLLERLLDTEMRRERLELLQCVKFICENNFFKNESS